MYGLVCVLRKEAKNIIKSVLYMTNIERREYSYLFFFFKKIKPINKQQICNTLTTVANRWPKLFQDAELRLCGHKVICNPFNKTSSQGSNKIYSFNPVGNL